MILTYRPVVVYLHAVRSILQGADMLDHSTRRQRCCCTRWLPPAGVAGRLQPQEGRPRTDIENWMPIPPFVTVPTTLKQVYTREVLTMEVIQSCFNSNLYSTDFCIATSPSILHFRKEKCISIVEVYVY